MCFSSPSIPAATAAPAVATAQDPSVTNALQAQLQRIQDAKGQSSTMLTGGLGLLQQPTTAPKTLLGS
jgi:hypothetical protein